VATVPPAETVDELVAATAQVRASAPELRWSPPSLWHLTLAFLGTVPEAVMPELERRLARVAARHRPVTAAVARAGQFGQRVLWLGVVGELAPLATGVRRSVERAGVTGLDTRPWRAHLTLARVPDGTDTDLVPLVAALRRLDHPRWVVDEIALMRSESGPRPSYTTVAGWPLTGTH
jgi:2'-5' RNA ligase